MTKKVWIISAILVVAGGIYLGTVISDSTSLSFLEEPVKTETEQVEVAQSPWAQEGNLYTTTVEYTSPAGDEANMISVTIENDTVQSFEMTIETKNDVSIAYQKRFLAELEKTVVGKKVSEIAGIDTVAGASLTTQAFKDAFAQL